MSIVLTQEQQDTIKIFMTFLKDPNETYMKIQGAAGCGKTTLIRYLFDAIAKNEKMLKLLLGPHTNKGKYKISLTATTNKAATVLADFTGYETSTIYNLLGIKVQPNYKTGELELVQKRGNVVQTQWNQIIIIDESSMVDAELFDYVMSSCKNCKIVFIGDKYQLAPINAKSSVMDRTFKYEAELSKILRNSGLIQSTGLAFRNTVRTGIFPGLVADKQDIYWVNGTTFQQEIDKVFIKSNARYVNSKIIAWTNKKVIAYNKYIRDRLNKPEHFQKGEYAITNKPLFGKGFVKAVDALIKITNMSDPITKRIETDTEIIEVKGHDLIINERFHAFLPIDRVAEKQVLKQLAADKAWEEYYHIKENWLDLRDTYASTIHKAQGSTYENVFINLTDIGKCTNSQTVARMLYVAISRASHKVFLFGNLPPKYTG